uniref:Chromosome 19 open reading frame 71 n=1 Tax=Pavo cristatus TaxID=9049 RepID=A0A8C9EIN8_PAVCR
MPSLTREETLRVLQALMSPPARSEQFVTLRGPRCAPVLRQAVRWKVTPLGRDAAGQSWWTEGKQSADPGAGEEEAAGLFSRRMGVVYDQHLREVACWDPTVPAAYPGPGTRWGAFLWQERPILGKEYGKSWGVAACPAVPTRAPPTAFLLLCSGHPQPEHCNAGGQPGVRPFAVLLPPPNHQAGCLQLEPPAAPALSPPITVLLWGGGGAEPLSAQPEEQSALGWGTLYHSFPCSTGSTTSALY